MGFLAQGLLCTGGSGPYSCLEYLAVECCGVGQLCCVETEGRVMMCSVLQGGERGEGGGLVLKVLATQASMRI